jgi:hypothetical protein
MPSPKIHTDAPKKVLVCVDKIRLHLHVLVCTLLGLVYVYVSWYMKGRWGNVVIFHASLNGCGPIIFPLIIFSPPPGGGGDNGAPYKIEISHTIFHTSFFSSFRFFPRKIFNQSFN